jgi:hypothetical protein
VTLQEAIHERAVERIFTCSEYTGANYGPKCRDTLIKAEEERIIKALIDMVCPPSQAPVEKRLSETPCPKCHSRGVATPTMAGGTKNKCPMCECEWMDPSY